MTTDERIARLERSNRWLRGAVYAIGVFVGVAALIGADDPTRKHPKLIAAEAFSLVDEDGKSRGVFATSGDETMLLLGGKDDRHTSIGMSKNGAELRISHPDTSKRIVLQIGRDGEVVSKIADGERVLWSAP